MITTHANATGRMTLVAILLLVSPAVGVAAKLQGKYEGGSYSIDGETVRFFAFTCSGPLTRSQVEKQGAPILRKLLSDGQTGKRYNPRRGDLTHPDKFTLNRGEIFVVGFVNETRQKWGWIAVDTDAAAFSKHRWIAVNGRSGVADSSQASVNPSRAAAVIAVPLTSRTTANLEVFTSSGWISWFCRGDD